MLTYKEFRETYKTTLKNYPCIDELFTDNPTKTITVNKTEYKKHGSKWIETESETKQVDFIYYTNIVDGIQFFRNLGGSETVKMGYTRKGYLPIKIISTSPNREDRSIYRFKF